MTKNIVLNAQKRTKEEKPNAVKREGNIPAVIYGSGFENTSLKINAVEFEKIYASVGGSTMIGLKIDSKEPVQIIIKDVHFDHKNQFNHIDFYKVDENKKISAPITFNFVGESDAVEKKNGSLNRIMDSIEVECLPGELVSHIDVDLSKLKEIGDTITIKDLALPKTFSLSVDESELVASVAEKKAVVEEAPVESVEDVKTEQKDDKKEEKKEDKKD